MVDPKENFYTLNKRYSLTLNPVDKFQFLGKVDRYNKFRNFIYEQLMLLSCTYEFFIELSEPRGMHTQGYAGPRLHLHGWIEFKTRRDIGKFLLVDFYKLTRFASIDIDTISNFATWIKYCKKQKIYKKNRLSNFSV